MKKGFALIISGPSGAGKSTVLHKALSLLGDEFSPFFSVSATTRPARSGEIDGEHYDFVTMDEFKSLIERDMLLEHAEFAGNFYGTKRAPIEKCLSIGRLAVLDIEVQGMLQVRDKFIECVCVYISPPSWEELERRLRERGTEDEEKIAKRLAIGREEYKQARLYDYIVVNRDVETAARDLAAVIRAESLKTERTEKLL